MSTVFLTSFNTLISRNIVSTGIIPRLVAAGVRVVVAVPDYKVPYFRETHGKTGAIFEGVDTGPAGRGRAVRLFKKLAEAMPRTNRAALGRRLTFRGAKKSALVYWGFYAPAGFLGRLRFLYPLFRWLDRKLTPRGRFYPLLDRYQPDLVFSTDAQNEHDVCLMQDAERRGIRVAAMVRSWDNLTTRLLRFVPERLIVHNGIIQAEAASVDGVDPRIVAVTGIPHYDRYLRGPIMGRGEFFRRIGADPAKKLILYTPICDFRLGENSVDRYILEMLGGVGANVVVRLHPAEPVNLEGFKKPPRMVFDNPGHVFDLQRRADRDITPEDDRRYVNELAHCDLVIAGPSTVVIDAALFDKPILLIDFYPRPVTDEERIYEYKAEHIAPILASGGVRVAMSKAEFLDWIQRYLADPALDREGRARIVEEQCWRADGKSSERVADDILRLLQESRLKP